MTTMEKADWSVIEDPEVLIVVEQVTRKVAEQYSAVCEEDDVRQEAFIDLATHPDEVRGYTESGNYGGLHHWLWCDMVDVVKGAAKKAGQTIHIERLMELPGEGGDE